MQGKLASFLNFINLLDTKVGKDLRTLTFDFSDRVVVHDYSNFMMETQWPTIKNIFYGLVCFRKLSEFIWKNPSAWIWGSGQYAPPLRHLSHLPLVEAGVWHLVRTGAH